MRNNATTRWRHFGTAALLLTTGCGLGGELDPRDHAPRTFALVARTPTWQPPVPVTAELPATAAPAPQFESALAPIPAPARFAVAVGQNVRHVVDGPLERAFAAESLGRSHTFTPCTDRDAIELLLVGRADCAVIGGQLSERDQQAGLQQTRLGVELFALAVAPEVSVRSLTRAQVRQVFTRQVTDWSQLGGERGPILTVVPAHPKLAERAAQALMPGDAFPDDAVRVASERHVVDQLLQHKGAIGIVRVTGEKLSGMKLLPIDWCPPTPEAFAYGTYPFGVPMHVVTSGPANGEAQRLLQFLRSDAAREQMAGKLLLP